MVERIKEIIVQYLTEKAVSEMTGRALSTLRNDRCQGRGLPYIVMGVRSIRYDLADVKRYMESRKVYTSDSPDPAASRKQ